MTVSDQDGQSGQCGQVGQGDKVGQGGRDGQGDQGGQAVRVAVSEAQGYRAARAANGRPHKNKLASSVDAIAISEI